MPALLKSLELNGYKTFANRSDFEFAEKVTAIVGPNGSGKSNIADALRWVLGEQSFSLLRGRRTEDMIFSGSEQKSRAGMASATIIFDNSNGWLPIDFSEVSISRRAFRDGQNEYLINGQRVRLRDISELLAKSGLAERTYTIIGQGLVDATLSLRVDERRRLFEEAAGISLYRTRREEALRRLDSTRRNIDRVKDILAELSPRLRSLDRQMRRYEEYEQVKNELHQVLLEWYGYHWHRSQQEYVERQEAARTHENVLLEARKRQASAETELDDMRQKYLGLRGQMGGWQGELGELHSRREQVSRELAVLEERRLALERQAKELEISLGGLEDQIAFESDRLENARQDLAAKAEENQEATSRASAARESLTEELGIQQALERALQEQRDLAARLAARKAEIAARLAELDARLERFDLRRSETAEASRNAESVYREAETSWKAQDVILKADSEARQQASKDLDRIQRDLTDLYRERTEVSEEIGGMQAEVARLEAQDEVLAQAERALVGYGRGARSLLQAARDGRITGIIGALRDFIEVPEALESAIAGALGEFVDGLLIGQRGDAETALGLLVRENNRGILLPLDDLEPSRLQSPPAGDGYIGVAADLIRYPPEAAVAVELILGKTFVVEDLAAAREVLDGQPPDARSVTLRGEVVTRTGPILAAASREDTTFSRPRRRRQLAAEIDSLSQSLKEAEGRHSLLEQEIGKLEARRDEARDSLTTADEALNESQEKTRQYQVQSETAGHQALWQRTQLEVLDREEAENRREREASNREQEELSIEERAIEERTRDLRGSLAGIQLEETREHVSHWEMQAAITQQVMDGARSRIDERAAALEQARNQKAELQTRLDERLVEISSVGERMSRLRDEENEIAGAIDSHRQRTGPLESDLKELEVALDQYRLEEAKVRQQLTLAERYHTQAQIALARQQEAMETLRHRIEDDFGLVAYAYEDEVTGPNPLPLDGMVEELPVVSELSPDLENSLNRRRLRLRRMGAVNPEAPVEFREVQERHGFLTDQLEDLEAAEQHIKDVIAELDTLMEREFRKTFEAVAGEFRANFNRLFGGGSARLILTDPEDLTNSGIDIDAQLPGRRTQGLSLLSGGERSLVASALIFALIQVSPTPFCVLDEVDAMLDEANVGRFREMLRELSEATQFILITHNRGTVEAADVIYGITMGRDSTSQILSLKLDQVPELVG